TGLDTPSLLAAWKDAPYLHDGSAPTLADAIDAHTNITLNPTERTQLVAFIQQLEGDNLELPDSTPYNLTPATIPGLIQAEDFDLGGQGISHFDFDHNNIGTLNYRNSSIDFFASSDTDGTPGIGWIRDGEWTQYTVDVTPGTYDLVARMASNTSNPGSVRIFLDNTLLGEITATRTGGWFTWADFTLPEIRIQTSGTARLRFEYQAGINFNWLEFRPSPLTFGDTPAPITARIQAEHYDTGGPGISYFDTDPENFGANFGPNHRDEGVDLEDSLDTDNTPAIGWIEDGEWLHYTIALTPGTYDLVARTASELNIPGSIRILLDNTPLGELDVQTSGGWYNWTDSTLPSITIPTTGTALLRLEFTGQAFNLNWLEFRDPSQPTDPTDPPNNPEDQTPYLGLAATVPGRIEAENFDQGPAGQAYLDSEEENFGATYTDFLYRPGGVDIEPSFDTPSTPSLGWTDPGEWLEYTINATAGTYDLKARVASGFTFPGGLLIELNGQTLGTLDAPGTGDWYNWQTLTLPNITIPTSGLQTLRITFNGNAGFNLNWLEIGDPANPANPGEPGDPGDPTDPTDPVDPGTQTPYLGTPWPIPGLIEAEHFDEGGQDIAYSDAEPQNLGGLYRNHGVDIEGDPLANNGHSIGWFDNGQWMEYTLAVTPGIYRLDLRVASAEDTVGDVRVTLDGTPLGTFPVESTGAWDAWQTLSLTDLAITTSGTQILRLEMIGDAVNVDSFTFTRTAAATNFTVAMFNALGQTPSLHSNADGDSASDLAEFAFGSNPNQSRSLPNLPLTLDQNGLCCQSVPVAIGGTLHGHTYTAAGITYTFQGSSDMQTWDQPLEFLPNPANLPSLPRGYKHLTFRLANHSLKSGFLRVKINEDTNISPTQTP
ncbi:MAG: carbohydrate-binding protein, partial [Verrucomicrobiota bacterium]